MTITSVARRKAAALALALAAVAGAAYVASDFQHYGTGFSAHGVYVDWYYAGMSAHEIEGR